MLEFKFDLRETLTSEESEAYYEKFGQADPEKRSFFLVIKNESGELIGGSHLTYDSTFMSINSMWIDPAMKRSGLGLRLMNEIRKLALEKNCSQVVLSTFESMGALDFWRRLGFQVVSEIKNCSPHDNLYYLNLR